MASEPTDLIRDTDKVIDDIDHGYYIGVEETKLRLRRLRDALEAAQKAIEWGQGAIDRRDAALAEANATIERVRALADTYGFTPNMTSAHHEIADQITCAIEGPAI